MANKQIDKQTNRQSHKPDPPLRNECLWTHYDHRVGIIRSAMRHVSFAENENTYHVPTATSVEGILKKVKTPELFPALERVKKAAVR